MWNATTRVFVSFVDPPNVVERIRKSRESLTAHDLLPSSQECSEIISSFSELIDRVKASKFFF